MDQHVDIRLRLDSEFPATVLMSTLFGKLHRALVDLDQDRIGVSFPCVDEESALGSKLRLHGGEGDLDQLMDHHWLTGMYDHIYLASVAEIPARTGHRIVRRVQAKKSPERIRRRQIRRNGLSEEEAQRRIPTSNRHHLNHPYLTLNSRSTDQRFRLFIEHAPLQEAPVHGKFSSYGLSNRATIPWF